MAFAIDATSGVGVYNSTPSGTTQAITLAHAVSVGDTIVLVTNDSGNFACTSISDSAGNTWGASPDVGPVTITAGSLVSRLWSCLSATHASSAGTLVITAHYAGTTNTNFGIELLVCKMTGGNNPTLGNTNSNHASSGTALTTTSIANPANSVAIEGTSCFNTITAVAGGFSEPGTFSGAGDVIGAQNLSSSGTVSGNATHATGAWGLVVAIYVQGGGVVTAAPVPPPSRDPRNVNVTLASLPKLGQGVLAPPNLPPPIYPSIISAPTRYPNRQNIKLANLPMLGQGSLIPGPPFASAIAQSLGGLTQAAATNQTLPQFIKPPTQVPGYPNIPIASLPKLGVGVLVPGPLPVTSSITQTLGGLTQSAATYETLPQPIRPPTRVPGRPNLRVTSLPLLDKGALVPGPAPPSVTTSITQNLGALRQSATAAETFAATIAQTLGGLSQKAAAYETLPQFILPPTRQPGRPNVVLSRRTALGRGILQPSPSTTIVAISATIAQNLGGLIQSATATETFAGTVSQHLGGLTQAATAAETFAATAAQKLSGLRQSATAGDVFAATVSQKLGGLRQSATATVPASGPSRQVLGERPLTAQLLFEGLIVDHQPGVFDLPVQLLGERLLLMQVVADRAIIVHVMGEIT